MESDWLVAIVGAAIAALALWPLVKGLRAFGLDDPSSEWPNVPGRVTKSEIIEGEKSRFEVEYRYEVDGVWYENDVLQRDLPTGSRAENEALHEQYAVGTEVAVRYDPASPSTAVLLPGERPRAALMVAMSLVVMLFSLSVAVGAGVREAAYLHNEAAAAPAGGPTAHSAGMQTPMQDLNGPTGIAVGTSGGVLVCDGGPTGSTAAGRLLRVYGNRDDLALRTLNAPIGVAFGKTGTIYVTDHDPAGPSGRLWKFTPDRTGSDFELMVNGVKPALTLLSPGGVAVDSAETVYVAEPQSGRVLRWTPGAKTATEFFKSPDDGSVTDVAIDSRDNVFITDSKNSRVWKIAAHSGASPMQVPAAFVSHPQGVAVDSADHLYVVDSGNHRVLKFEGDLNSAAELPFSGLDKPYDVAVQLGDVYVTDQGNGRVVMLDREWGR